MTVKRIIYVSLLIVALVTSVSSQIDHRSARKQKRIKADLIQLERDIGRANITRDYDFFDRVEAEEFIFTDSAGGITTKKEDLAELKRPASPDSKLIAYDVDQMHVLLYDKCAVVTGLATIKHLAKGKEVINQNRFTDVFVWRQGRWQIVAGHSSRVKQS